MGDRVDDTAGVVYWTCASYSQLRCLLRIVLLRVFATQVTHISSDNSELETLEDIFVD